MIAYRVRAPSSDCLAKDWAFRLSADLGTKGMSG